MCDVVNCNEYCDRYDHDQKLEHLAKTLTGMIIEKATIYENASAAVVDLQFSNGRSVHIGVSGNLHDEAYLMFHEREKR